MLVFQANISPGETNNIKTMSYLVSGAQAQVWNQGVGGAFIEQVMKDVVVWFFMLGSLMAAQSMSITGAGAALGMIKSAEKWAGGKVKNAGKRGLSAAGRGVGADKKMEDLARGLQKIPGIGGALSSSVRGVASKTKTTTEKQEALTAKEKANFERRSDEALADEQRTYENSRVPGSKAKVAQIAAMRARRGSLNVRDANGEIDPARTGEETRRAYAAAKQSGNKEALDIIAKSNPIVFGKIKEEEFEEDLKKGDVIESFDPITRERILRNKKTGK